MCFREKEKKVNYKKTRVWQWTRLNTGEERKDTSTTKKHQKTAANLSTKRASVFLFVLVLLTVFPTHFVFWLSIQPNILRFLLPQVKNLLKWFFSRSFQFEKKVETSVFNSEKVEAVCTWKQGFLFDCALIGNLSLRRAQEFLDTVAAVKSFSSKRGLHSRHKSS